MTITTAFELRQMVFIPELEKVGRVIGFYVSKEDTVSYEIRYFYNGAPQSVYFRREEISEQLPARAPAIAIE